MHRFGSVLFALSVIAISTVSCGGGTKSTPTAPTSTAPPALSLSFAFDPAGYAGNRSFSFTDGGVPAAGQLDVNVMANNFDRAVVRFRGTVLFDPSKVELVSYGEGPFMKQNNALATFSVSRTSAGNGVDISVTKPDTVLGSTGSGIVVQLRFRGLAAGTTPLQWTNASARTTLLGDEWLNGTQGGTISIR